MAESRRNIRDLFLRSSTYRDTRTYPETIPDYMPEIDPEIRRVMTETTNVPSELWKSNLARTSRTGAETAPEVGNLEARGWLLGPAGTARVRVIGRSFSEFQISRKRTLKLLKRGSASDPKQSFWQSCFTQFSHQFCQKLFATIGLSGGKPGDSESGFNTKNFLGQRSSSF